MKRIRKGNDIIILWEIYTGMTGAEKPYDMAGKNLRLYLSDIYGKRLIEDFTTEGNVLRWVFSGKDQRHVGVYSLILVENEGEGGMHTLDECNAFELVNCSHMEGGYDDEGMRTETVLLQGRMALNEPIVDQELNEDSPNPISNSAATKGLKEKVNKVEGMGLSSNDYTDDDKNKLYSLENYDDSGLWKKVNENEGYISQLSGSVEEVRADISALDTKVEEVNADVYTLNTKVEGKATPDGTYPNMTVGLADDLGGRPYYDESEFTFRATAGSDTSIKDGLAEITELHGNSVVWNQKVQLQDRTTVEYGVTFNIQADNTIVVNGEAVGGVALYGFAFEAVKDHIYVMKGCPTGGSANTYRLHNQKGSSDVGTGCIYQEVRDTGIAYNILEVAQGASVSNLIFRPRIIDLTLMFGEGYEPTTIEEYNARKPIVADEYAYNEGEVIHMTAEGIKSVGDNAWDEEWEQGGISEINGTEYDETYLFRTKNYIRVLPNTQYYFKKPIGIVTYLMFYDDNKNFVKWLDPFATVGEGGVFTTPNAPYMRFMCIESTYKNDITISLYHSGWKQDTDAKYQPYWEDRLMFDKRIKDEFPDGMPKWDMVYNKNDKGYVSKGMGVVEDMSQLDWYGGPTEFYTLDSIFYRDQGVMCARYTNIAGYNEQGNMYPVNGALRIYDSSYTDAASIKASLQGVPLYYQLAEPTIIEYDEPFNLDYRVADFGTEEVLSENQSAPIKATIQYNFNANDTIRTNKIAIRNLERKITELTTLLSQIAVKVKEVE